MPRISLSPGFYEVKVQTDDFLFKLLTGPLGFMTCSLPIPEI